ncbi:hypothetical protein ACFQNE_11585 [Gordonia phosphorivorans]|uniref:RCK N-terminal domain-containing protein n=1 Tax=Gordonia phosphorivorans TaxID=1056982 RepID=A0ABV6HAZ6_9ACTN
MVDQDGEASQSLDENLYRRTGEVIAEQLREPWDWGAGQRANAGDWRVYTVEGWHARSEAEKRDVPGGLPQDRPWAIAASMFPSRYEFVADVEPDPTSVVSPAAEPDFYRFRRTGTVRARPRRSDEPQVTPDGLVPTTPDDNGPQKVAKWVVTDLETDDSWNVSEDHFHRTYRKVTPPSRWTQFRTGIEATGTVAAVAVQTVWATGAATARRKVGALARLIRVATPTVVPTILTLWAFGAFFWGYSVVSTTYEDASSSFWQRAFATLLMFGGGYAPLIGGEEFDPVPTPKVAMASVIAFSVTIAAASGIALKLSALAWRRLWDWLRRPRLVVIGSDEAAAAITRSCIDHGLKALLITEDGAGEAAKACGHVIPKVEIGTFAECGRFGVPRRVLQLSDNVVIATDSDSRNLTLQPLVLAVAQRKHRGEADSWGAKWRTLWHGRRRDRFSVVAVVEDAGFVDAMRPIRLAELSEEGITCPADNIAEHVCHIIDSISTGPSAVVKPADSESAAELLIETVVVEIVDATEGAAETASGEALAVTLRRWVRRQQWGRAFLRGDRSVATDIPNEIVGIRLREGPHDADPGENDLLVRVYVGRPDSAVMTRVLADRSSDLPPPVLTVVVAEGDLVATAMQSFDRSAKVVSGRDWLTTEAGKFDPRTDNVITYIDPDQTGLDAHLVTDDVRLQSARLFHQTYEFMFASGEPVGSWLPGEPLASQTKAEERAAARRALTEWWATRDRTGIRAAASSIETARQKVRKRINNWYSSERAARNMLEFLKAAGWELRRFEREGAPAQPAFPGATVNDIAEREHDNWRERCWHDTSRRRRFRVQRTVGSEATSGASSLQFDHKLHRCADYSSSGADALTFKLLNRLTGDYMKAAPKAAENRRTVEYNRRIVTETYPAIAAYFGYVIVPRDPGPLAETCGGGAIECRPDVH